MSCRLLTHWNATVFVRENEATAQNVLIEDGTDWADFEDGASDDQFFETRLCLAPSASETITLPSAMTAANKIAWKSSQKVDLTFDFGIIPSTSYGIMEGEFTSLQIDVSSGYTEDVTVHLVIIGS